nr:putative nitrite reductase (NAD(P)H), large subunit [Burkholderia pseudomallei]
MLHLRLELRREPELVVHDHVDQVVEPALEVVAPHARALQAVGRADVEHQEAVDVAHERRAVQIGREQLRVARLHPAVAAHVQVPALLGRDHADILALRLRALARAAGHTELQLVRRAQPLVAVLELDREADRIADAVAAPRRADARFHGAHRFAVRVARFEAGRDQFFPDERQLLDARAEQVHALATRDLRVEAVLARDLADRDQPFGRDFAAGHARHDRIGAVALDVREVVIVRILQRRVLLLQHELVPARCEDAGDGRLADVAAEAAPVLLQKRAERLEPLDAHHVIELLARIRKVLAQVVVHGEALLLHLGLQHLRDERHAAAARRARAGAALQRAEARRAARHRLAKLRLRHVVARADLRGVGQRIDAERRFRRAVRLRQDQEFGRPRQLDAVQHHLQQRAVVGRVAHHHRAEQCLPAFGHDELLVDAAALVGELVRAAAGRPAVRVADARDVDAHQLELRAQVRAGERALAARELPRDDARHVVAGRDEAEGLAVPCRALADRVDILIARAAALVDRDAAARADLEPACAGDLVARPDAGGEHDHVGIEMRAVGERHPVRARLAVDDLERVLARVHLHAERLDLLAQHPAAALVDLHGHQPRRELDHVRGEPHVAQRLRAFEPEQPAADDDARVRARAAGPHRLEILDRPVDEAAGALAAGHVRHERRRAGGEHELVVRERLARRQRDRARGAVDRDRLRVQQQPEVRMTLEEAGLDERQIVGGLAGEEFGQVDAIVRGARFLADHRDPRRGERARRAGRDAFEQLVTDHAVTDDDDFHDGCPLLPY